jgi:DNA-binding transcriptional MocR family regulator
MRGTLSWRPVAEKQSISLSRGAPSLDIIAVDDLRESAVRAFERDPAGTFAYGTSMGYKPLVHWIAAKHGVEPDQVIATNGSMQADAFLFERLVEPGDQVVVEAPTYDRTLLALRKLGAELLAIPLEDDGIDVEALARALEAGARPKLAHIIPNFHNPGGCTLSLDKRRRLLELALEYDFVVFEDDPYVELRFEGEQHPTMLSLDGDGRVVYASSFSKTVCPGIRVGYLAGPAELISEIRKTATETYISPSMVSQSIVAEFCESGAIERTIETVKAGGATPPATRSSASCPTRPSRRRRAATSCGSTCPRAPTWRSSSARPPCAASTSSRARTSCSRAATTRSASRTRA